MNRMLAMLLLGVTAAIGAELPYAVRPDGQAKIFALTVDGQALGTAALSWRADGLVLDVRVADATPVALADVGCDMDEAYLADSVEFWVGRHQFVAAKTAEGGKLWDYLYRRPVDKAEVVFEDVAEGYRVRVCAPWPALALEPQPGLSFSFLLQVNDRQRFRDGARWKESSRQPVFPTEAVWDHVSTYGTVFLATNDAVGTAPEPRPFAALEIRQFAYAMRAEAVVQRLAPFDRSELVLVCRDPRGTVVAEFPVPSADDSTIPEATGHGSRDARPPVLAQAVLTANGGRASREPHLAYRRSELPLPWDASQAGIFRAELYLVHDGRRYGPVAEPYFNGGATTIAEYRSDRLAPPDLRAFWDAKIAAMRERPMHAAAEEVPSARAGVIVERVRLENHRGQPMMVWVTRAKGETERRPAHLNVYPPMRAESPEWPRQGYLGLTFCGSRQGACRLPEQKGDEDLWARAEALDDCAWLDVVLDGVRAMDYVASRPDSNGRVLVTGGSRGGWYALALAAVTPDRVALAAFTSPCYSDVTMNQQLGYGSAATEIFMNFEHDRVVTGGKVFANFRYFDPLFLAELIRTPVVFSAGLQDTICSAIGMTAAANRIPKELCTFVLDPEGGHGGSPWMHSINRAAEAQAVQMHDATR